MSDVLPSDRLKGNEENVWVEFVGLVMKHKALNLGQGFTDFCPPSTFTNELSKVALSSDYRLNQYTRGFGYVPLVEVLARFYSSLLGHRVDPMNEVLITPGAYQALFYSAFAFISNGDEQSGADLLKAIIIEPYFDCYEPQVRMAGGKPVFVPLRLKTKEGDRMSSSDYVLDVQELESVVTEKTKLLYLNNPMNPTGKVYTRRELEAIADIVKRHNLVVISDEVYEWLIYENSEMIRFGWALLVFNFNCSSYFAASLPDMWDRTITIGSVGKTFSLTGWKAAVASCFENQLKLYPTLDCYFLEMPRILQPKRDLLAEILLEGAFEPVVPEGGYFMVADYTKLRRQHISFGQVNYKSTPLSGAAISIFTFNFILIPTALSLFVSKSINCYSYMSIPQVSSDGDGLETDVKTFREFLQQYNRVSEGCFLDCVHDFTTRTVSKREEQCALNCMEKYLKMTQRISQRFQEFQLLQAEASGTSPIFQNNMNIKGHLHRRRTQLARIKSLCQTLTNLLLTTNVTITVFLWGFEIEALYQFMSSPSGALAFTCIEFALSHDEDIKDLNNNDKLHILYSQLGHIDSVVHAHCGFLWSFISLLQDCNLMLYFIEDLVLTPGFAV
ncbi:kynurenine--oxoglutarate transaminase domain protein [Trichuris suis]|nr:kynurenine--oxoglutarate transaminase domain protein [Trichuris suis]